MDMLVIWSRQENIYRKYFALRPREIDPCPLGNPTSYSAVLINPTEVVS